MEVELDRESAGSTPQIRQQNDANPERDDVGQVSEIIPSMTGYLVSLPCPPADRSGRPAGISAGGADGERGAAAGRAARAHLGPAIS
jgi:hypothetical protein